MRPRCFERTCREHRVMSIRETLRQFRVRRNRLVNQVAEQFNDVILWVFRRIDRFFSRTDSPTRQQQPRSWILAPTLLYYFLLFGPCPRWEDASWCRRAFMLLAIVGFFGCGFLLDQWKYPKQGTSNLSQRRSRMLFFWQF